MKESSSKIDPCETPHTSSELLVVTTPICMYCFFCKEIQEKYHDQQYQTTLKSTNVYLFWLKES